MKTLQTIYADCNVGIYENCEKKGRIYPEMIVVVEPYVKWVGNTGGYAERKVTLRDAKLAKAVLAVLADDDQDEDDAWELIDKAMQ